MNSGGEVKQLPGFNMRTSYSTQPKRYNFGDAHIGKTEITQDR